MYYIHVLQYTLYVCKCTTCMYMYVHVHVLYMICTCTTCTGITISTSIIKTQIYMYIQYEHVHVTYIVCIAQVHVLIYSQLSKCLDMVAYTLYVG